MNLPCIPLGDRVLVELATSIVSAGGIQLPEKEVKYGIVRSIGMGVPPHLVRYHVGDCKECNTRGMDIGDKVFLPRGDEVGDKFVEDNKVFLLVPSQYIGGIIS